MRRRILIGAAAAALCLAAAGCAGRPAGAGAGRPQETRESGGAEAETEKPTAGIPAEIAPFPDGEKETPAASMENGVRIVQMSDIHYMARSLTDMGEGFDAMVEHGDGKLTNYVWEITDAALKQAELLSPNVLLLSGDLSLQGEKESHEALAQKLKETEADGLQVVVIPGNHDISNPSASSYKGAVRTPAESVTAEEFAAIYADFGYSQAASRDPASLSYTYDLTPSMRLMLLDSCQYENGNKVGGMIRTETYDWIRAELAKAREDGAIVLPVAHHNLLEESEVYVDDCTIEHSEELIRLLEGENIPLFLSGHLHVQHFMRHNDIGIWEVVTSSLSTPPCQFGVLEYRDDESFSYHTEQVDMERWARRSRSTDENLINFNTYSPQTLRQIFYNKAYDAMRSPGQTEDGRFGDLTEEQRQKMSLTYALLCSGYYAGKAYEVVDEAVAQEGYALWNEYGYPSILAQYLDSIVRDAVRDYNSLTSP